MPDIEQELRRFAYKVEAGAEYAITQPVFDLRLLEDFLERIEEFRIPVIAGIWPLTSLRNAEFMKNDLRVSMPEEIMLRMAQADTPEAARAEGIKIAQEMLEAVRPMVQGVQVSAPFGRYSRGCRSHRQRPPTGNRCSRSNFCMPSFEESLKKLETIVDKLEKGDLSLEESLKLFEEGVGLRPPAKKSWKKPRAKCRCSSSSAMVR